MTKRNIGWNWSTNGKRAYFNLACEVKGSCDDETVFCAGARMDGGHPETFQVLPDGSFARDKGQYFNLERTISAGDYVKQLREQFVFVGTIVSTSVVDRDKREVPECLNIERASNLGVSIRIRCEKILFDPGSKVDHSPAPGEEFVFTSLPTARCLPRELGNHGFGFSTLSQSPRPRSFQRTRRSYLIASGDTSVQSRSWMRSCRSSTNCCP